MTLQPWSTSPSTCSGPTRTSSRKTSQNSAWPVISRIGRTSMPGRSIGITNAVMPACRSTVGSVRASSVPMSAHCASVLQIFWPVTSQPSPSRLGPGAERRQVAAGVGLAEQLAPDVLAGADPRQQLLLLRLGAELEQRVRRQHHLVERAVGVAEDELLHEHEVVDREVTGPAAPGLGPPTAEVAGVVERGQPAADGPLLVGVTRDPHPLGGHRVRMLGDERPHLPPVRVDVNHAVHPSSSAIVRSAERGLAASRGVLVGAALVEVQAVLPGEADRSGELEQVVQHVDGARAHARLGQGDRTSGPGCTVAEQAGRLRHSEPHAPGPHGVVDQPVLHGLEPADRLAEGAPLARRMRRCDPASVARTRARRPPGGGRARPRRPDRVERGARPRDRTSRRGSGG